jgi:spore germination protein KB
LASTRLTYGSRSLAAFGIMVIMAQSYHPLLLVAIERGKTAAWLVTLMASLLAALAVWPVAAALQGTPGSSLPDMAREVLGRPGAVITGLMLSAILLFISGMILRETSEMAISAAFPHTPQTFATTALLLGSIYVAYGDGPGLVRLGRLVLPLVICSILLVLAGSFGWGNLRYLAPVWGPGLPRLALSVPEVAMLFAPAAILTVLTGSIGNRKAWPLWDVATPPIAGAFITLETGVLTMVLPYPVSASVTFPLHAAARILLGGRFFERMDGIWLFMWVWSTTILSGALLYAAAVTFIRAFGMPRHVLAILPMATVTLSIAFFSRNQADTIILHERAAWPISLVTLAMPLLISLAALWRRRRRRS